MTEQEERIIKLEAIVHGIYECVEKMDSLIPIRMEEFDMATELARQFFNIAEVRSNITDLVNFKLELADEE